MTHPVSLGVWRRLSVASAFVMAAALALGLSTQVRADEGANAGAGATAPTAAEEPAPEKPKIDVKKLFAMNCAWCHGGYGTTEGKGPKLAGTKLSAEEVYARIEKGKSGAMPGFAKVLNKDQIQAFVDYIKGLPSN